MINNLPSQLKSKKRNRQLLGNNGDFFAAAVINQKSVNQNAQQVLVAVSIQAVTLIEAQFGFVSEQDNDDIDI